MKIEAKSGKGTGGLQFQFESYQMSEITGGGFFWENQNFALRSETNRKLKQNRGATIGRLQFQFESYQISEITGGVFFLGEPKFALRSEN